MIQDVPPYCPTAQPFMPISQQPKQNWAEGGTAKINASQTSLSDQMPLPVHNFVLNTSNIRFTHLQKSLEYTLLLFISTSASLAPFLLCRRLLRTAGVSSQLLLLPNSSSMGDRDLFRWLLQSGTIFRLSSSSLFFSLSRNSLLNDQNFFCDLSFQW